MTHAAGTPDLDALLRNDAWMRRLAVQLVRSADLADDVVQEALLVAIKSPPKQPGRVDAWFGGVLRHVARRLSRHEWERPSRERVAARDEAQSAHTGLVQQVKLQQTLVDAVLELKEPWQTAVLLRFYADLSSVEIGRQLNVPDATVRSWLHRALAELREKVEKETCGEGGDLRSALLPFMLTRAPAGASSLGTSTAAGTALTAAGVLLMALHTKLALVAVVVTLAAGSWWAMQPTTETPPSRPAKGVGESRPADDGPSTAGAPVSPVIVTPFAEARPQPAGDSGSVVGQVVDALGEPIAAADVWLVERDDLTRRVASTRTDRSGAFVLAPAPFRDGLLVHATSPGRSIGTAGVSVRADKTRDKAYLQLWDAASIRGTVTDSAGKPIPGAIMVAGAESWRSHSQPLGETTTDKDGRFELTQVPLGPVSVRAFAPGHEMGSQGVYLRGDAEVDVRVPDGAGVELTVRVAGLEGRASRAATVRVRPYSEGSSRVLATAFVRGRLKDDGTWRATGLPDFEYVISVESADCSFQPREYRRKPGTGPCEASFRAFPSGTVVCHGTVRDAGGMPLPNETIVCRAINGGRTPTAVTGPDGGFKIETPLAPGEDCIYYLVRSRYVLDQNKSKSKWPHDLRFLTYWETTIDPATALDLSAVPRTRVHGRVLDQDGQPVPRADIALQERQTNRGPQWMDYAFAETDVDGRFEFGALHAMEGEVRVAIAGRHGSGLSRAFHIAAGGDLDDIDLVALAPAIVEGTARDAEGHPVPGARVWLTSAEQDTVSLRNKALLT